jgi:hypothetical protein
MLRDVHPSVLPPVKYQQAFLMTYKAVILCAAALSICLAFSDFYVVSHPPPAIAAAVLSHYPGDHAHERSSLAFPNSSAVPEPTLINQSNYSNTQGPVIPLVAVLQLLMFLR